jgi:hypothetical protein
MPWLALPLVLGVLTAHPGRAPADDMRWMSEGAMRTDFTGKKLQGYYRSGLTWAASYLPDGNLDYVHGGQPAAGRWYLRGEVFCVFYQTLPPLGSGGGCLNVIKLSSNCYEYYRTELNPDPVEDENRERGWHSRGWRQGERPTCDDKPTA